jgi:ribulose-5-phosphate 4-epimerase/fuculose-1-phosphate aldolase
MAGMSMGDPSDGPGEPAVRAAIVAAGRRLRTAGLVAATEGNLSARLAGDRLLITPSGRRKDELGVDDLVVVALGVDPRGASDEESFGSDVPMRKPSSDVAVHRAMYAARPDVTAIVHAHLPAAMALTLAGEVPDVSARPETALFLGTLPFLPFGQPGSDELAARVAAALRRRGARGGGERAPVAVLLERHGAVAIGTGDPAAAIDQAVDRLELVEVLCRTWRDALLVGAARAAETVAGPGGRTILPPPSPIPDGRHEGGSGE